jgi:hypothetical protein
MNPSPRPATVIRPLYAMHPPDAPVVPAGTAVATPASGRFALMPDERMALGACLGSAVIAILLPYPATKLVIGAGLGMLFTVLSLRHFYIAVALFAFCLPLQPLMPRGSFFVPGLNLQTLFVVGFFVLSVLATGRRPEAENMLTNKLTVPLVAFVGIGVLSALHAAVVGVADGSTGDLFAEVKNVLIYTTFAFFTFTHVRQDREKQFVMLLIITVIALTAARSMQQVFSGGFALNPLGHRAISLIVDQPNLWGGFLAMYAFVYFGILLHWRQGRWAKMLTYLGVAIVLVNLIYTLSRGAWMAFGAAVAIVALMKAPRLLIPVLIVGATLYTFMPSAAVERFQSGFEGEYDPSLLVGNNAEAVEAASRIIQWRTFVPLLAYVGPFGAGFGRYPVAFSEAGLGTMNLSAHSSVIATGVEMGWIGLGVYFWLFGTVYRRATMVLKETDSPVSRSLALGLLGCTVCLVLLDLTGARSRSSQVMLFYWMLAGMTFNIPLRSDRR